MSTRYGYTTDREGRADTNCVAVIRRVAVQGGVDIGNVADPDVLLDREFIAATVSDDYVIGVRVGGVKLTIDGSRLGLRPGWLLQRGMLFGTHHDAPVAFPDSMHVLDATVTRC